MGRLLIIIGIMLMSISYTLAQSARYVQLYKNGNIINQFPADNTVELEQFANSKNSNGSDLIKLMKNGETVRVYSPDSFDSIEIVDIPDNEIWYTTTHGRLLQPNTQYFGANLVSNEYVGGKGIMRFDGPVTTISEHAFENFGADNNLGMKTILLPSAVTSIGAGAFYRCENLEYIFIPDGVTYIDSQAFMYTKLREITLPDEASYGMNILCCNPQLQAIYNKNASSDNRSLIVDGRMVSFAPCGLTSYSIPDGVCKIDDLCFASYSNMNEIKMPGSLREIGVSAFEGTSIKNIVVPEGVVSIGKWAFRLNETLETLTLPQSLIDLGESVATGCSNLRAFYGKYSSCQNKALVVDGKLTAIAPYDLTDFITTPDLKTIGYATFWGNNTIGRVILNEGLTEIENDAFFACSNLTHISFPSSLTKVGDRILASCSSLSSMSGPCVSDDGRCLIVGSKLYAFVGAGLNHYAVPSDVKEIRPSAFESQYQLRSITLPEGLNTICNDAFRICPALEEISLPASIKKIGGFEHGMLELFYGCDNLSKLFCKSTEIPQLLSPLIMPRYCNIYVPENMLENYRNNADWGQYNISGFDPDYKGNYYESTDYSADGMTVTLQTATRGNGIDIFIMGDGYTDRLIANKTYDIHMRKAMDAFFSEEPYASFKDYFNVYYVVAVSKNDVYSPYTSTVFNCNFGYGTTVGGNDDKVRNYAYMSEKVKSNENLFIIVLNSDKYAGTTYMYRPFDSSDFGSGASFAYCPIGVNDTMYKEAILHEAGGHGFAKLADEYFYDGEISETEKVNEYEYMSNYGWYKNIDFTPDPESVKWSVFLQDMRYKGQGLGVFEGACTYKYGAYRPTDYSIMRENTGGFNAPSRQSIYQRIHKLAFGDGWTYNHETFVNWDERNRTASAARRRMQQLEGLSGFNRQPLAPPVVIDPTRYSLDNELQRQIKPINR